MTKTELLERIRRIEKMIEAATELIKILKERLQ